MPLSIAESQPWSKRPKRTSRVLFPPEKMSRKLFVLAVLAAVAALAHAEDKPVTEKKPEAEPTPATTEEKKEGVDSRIGFGTGFGHVAGGNGYGFNRGVSGFNQGSGGFGSANAFNNVQGFRNRDGYRTNHGFDQTTYNRYGAGYGGFNNGFNRGAGGFYNQYGGHGGFLG